MYPLDLIREALTRHSDSPAGAAFRPFLIAFDVATSAGATSAQEMRSTRSRSRGSCHFPKETLANSLPIECGMFNQESIKLRRIQGGKYLLDGCDVGMSFLFHRSTDLSNLPRQFWVLVYNLPSRVASVFTVTGISCSNE